MKTAFLGNKYMTHYPRHCQRLQSQKQSYECFCVSVFRSIVILSVFKCVVLLLACLSDAPISPRPKQGISQRCLNGFHLRCSCRTTWLRSTTVDNGKWRQSSTYRIPPCPSYKSNKHNVCDTMAGSPESAVARFVQIWSTSLSYAVALFHRLLLAYSTSLLTCERRTHRMQHLLQHCWVTFSTWPKH